MKKIIAVLLAVLAVFSCTAMAAAAEDVSEPEQTAARYEFCEDPDFMKVVLMDQGNDKATILHANDIVAIYTKNAYKSNLVIEYYPDADGMYKGDWTPADSNNLAFSISGEQVFTDIINNSDSKLEGVVRNIDFTDYTIAYSEENTFVGWAIFDFKSSSSSCTLKLVGVWEKNHKVPVADDRDDLEYILNLFFGLRQKIAAPFFNAIKKMCNAVLFVKVWLYDLIFGAKTAA